jgi:hypothetical protein
MVNNLIFIIKGQVYHKVDNLFYTIKYTPEIQEIYVKTAFAGIASI